MAAITSIQQFLSTVLSQRGPNALPYHEPTKLLIRNHLLTLIQSYPSLHLSVSVFTHNDGRSSNLLHCHGTVPITFRGSTYNIPVSIWLLDSYPHQPPYVLLTPTPNMSVQPNHPYVDRDCSVHVPYLRSWIYPSSNLLDLVKSMCQLFGQDPPLYSNPNPSPTPSPSPNPNLSPTASPSPIPSPSPRIYSSFSGSQYGGGRVERPPVPARPSGMVGMDDPAEVYRRNAINKILENVHGDLAMLRKNQEAEMENMFSTQAVLRQREQEILKGMREMIEEKEALEQQLQVVMMNSDVLEGWVKENEGRKMQDVVQVDEVFETVDVGSKQLLECTAADLAVEDTVYSLDKAVQEGVISFEVYLKSVRVLSREQFFHRALAAKVKAAQVQAQVQSMAARVPSQYAS